MNIIESETSEFEIENCVMVLREILGEKEYEENERKNILLQYMTAVGIKPVSLIDLNNNNRDLQLNTAERLGLKYSKTEEDEGEFGEIIVSNNQDKIEEFKRLQEEWDVEKDEYGFDLNRKLGKILGYTDSAIEEFVRSAEEFDPPEFWKDVIGEKEIPAELVLVLEVIEMTPANIDDYESIQLGKKIRKLLDKIDPKLAERIIESRRKELHKEAQKTMEHFYKD